MKILPALALSLAVVSSLAETPPDRRLGPLKDLDGDFSWTPFSSKEAWAKRADELRMQMRVALGIWPEPTRTPLHAVIHGKIEREDYSVEKVSFESMPGFFVTGSLFRPKDVAGKKIPAVLCPHGHWQDARVSLKGDAEVKKEIASGYERFEKGGRSAFQSIGVQLARMGCVAFVIDMLGNSDSQQIGAEIAHGFKKQRPEMISPVPGEWGLYSPQAESHLQSVMGLQTWNCIRALDFLTSLPEVDPARLACTGASGGGTQTMILGALDPRLAVSFPCVMVSTAMQGGCTCENASLLRVGTGNIEFAALFAPKPMGLTTANDWTIDLPTKGFPELQKHWAMTGAPENVKLFAHPEFPHNYNIVTREHIYGFFNEHLKLGLPGERLKERDYEPLTREQLTVWDAQHPAPSGGPEFEKRLLKWWHDDAQQQMRKDAAAFEKIARPGVRAVFGAIRGRAQQAVGGRSAQWVTVGGDAADSSLLLLSNEGAEAVTGRIGATASAARLVAGGFAVSGATLWNQPSAAARAMDGAKTRRVNNPRESAAYTFGYNRPDIAERVHDVLGILNGMTKATPGRRAAIVSLDRETAPIAAAAAAIAKEKAGPLAVNTRGFRFQNVDDIRDPMFLPGGAKYGDVPGLLALRAPGPLLLMGEGPAGPELAGMAYEAAGRPDAVRVQPGADLEAIVKWLNETTR